MVELGFLRDAVLPVLLCWFLVALPVRGEALDVHQDGARITFRTETLELTLERGAVVGLRDLRTGEVFCDAPGATDLDRLPSGCSSKDDWWTFKQAWVKGEPNLYVRDAACQAARRS